jgi:hypothetical protein
MPSAQEEITQMLFESVAAISELNPYRTVLALQKFNPAPQIPNLLFQRRKGEGNFIFVARGWLFAWALVKTDPLLPTKSRPPVKQDMGSLPRG